MSGATVTVEDADGNSAAAGVSSGARGRVDLGLGTFPPGDEADGDGQPGRVRQRQQDLCDRAGQARQRLRGGRGGGGEGLKCCEIPTNVGITRGAALTLGGDTSGGW